MLVLLTNDDGLGAPGLHALADALTQYGHEVWIAAPASDQSGVSHGLSLTVPLRIDKPDERVFSCCGKPADCVIAAFDGLLPRLPDAVLSGINNGANLGTDLVFSGTAAAARQALLPGLRRKTWKRWPDFAGGISFSASTRLRCLHTKAGK